MLARVRKWPTICKQTKDRATIGTIASTESGNFWLMEKLRFSWLRRSTIRTCISSPFRSMSTSTWRWRRFSRETHRRRLCLPQRPNRIHTPKSSNRPNQIYRFASSDWISLFTFPTATLINYQTVPNNAPPDASSNALLSPSRSPPSLLPPPFLIGNLLSNGCVDNRYFVILSTSLEPSSGR